MGSVLSHRLIRTNVKRRIGCFTKYMTQRRGIPANRIRVMSGGYRKDVTIELRLVPNGAATHNVLGSDSP